MSEPLKSGVLNHKLELNFHFGRPGEEDFFPNIYPYLGKFPNELSETLAYVSRKFLVSLPNYYCTLQPLMYDPLQIDLKKQLDILLASVDASGQVAKEQKAILQNPLNGGEVLSVLSQLLRFPPLTTLVARLFRPLIVDLCARWLDLYEDEVSAFIALAFLLGWHPEIYP
jgi:hypothetical protein